jgi:hypothetical protein
MEEKTCTKCGKAKNLEEFRRDSTRASGHKQPCLECWRQHERARKRQRSYNRTYEAGKRQRLKAKVLQAYGGQCVCCGEDTPEFLTVDHINNDGAEHRRQLNMSSGGRFYRWLKTQGFPRDSFQLLCFNCNCAKGYFGECPHQRTVVRAA